MSTWNNRCIVQTYNKGKPYEETTYSIREVYYDDDGEVLFWSERPASAVVFEVQEFPQMFQRFQTAIEKPWLQVSEDEHGNEILVEYKGGK